MEWSDYELIVVEFIGKLQFALIRLIPIVRMKRSENVYSWAQSQMYS